MLELLGYTGFWQGYSADNFFFVRVSDATLRRYMAAWLELRCITEPTEDEKREAFMHCRRVAYWETVRGDPDVQTARSPQRKPPEQH